MADPDAYLNAGAWHNYFKDKYAQDAMGSGYGLTSPEVVKFFADQLVTIGQINATECNSLKS